MNCSYGEDILIEYLETINFWVLEWLDNEQVCHLEDISHHNKSNLLDNLLIKYDQYRRYYPSSYHK